MTRNQPAGATPPRLNVNITPATRTAINDVATTEHITHTEALRRLVALGVLLHHAHILIRRPDDILERIIPV